MSGTSHGLIHFMLVHRVYLLSRRPSRSQGRYPWAMQRQSEHTYALPSSLKTYQAAPAQQPSQSRSAPPSPRAGILLTTPNQYGSSVNHPLAYRHKNLSSSSLLATPLTPPPLAGSELPPPALPEHLSYRAADWSLLAIERPQARAKYMVSLLYHPCMTLYTWPIDPRKPPAQGTCFVTRVGSTESPDDDSATTLRRSLRLLEDCLRTWIRNARPRARSPGASGRSVASDAEIELVTSLLHLTATTKKQRAQWLDKQKIPEVIPTSAPTSPLATPSAMSEDAAHSAPSGSPSSTWKPSSRPSSLSPHARQRAHVSLSPIQTSERVTKVRDPKRQHLRERLPSVFVTESSPVVASAPALSAVNGGEGDEQAAQRLEAAIEALSLHEGPPSAPPSGAT